MLIIPLSSDAPVYHPPRGTFLLIALNFMVYIFQLTLFLGGETGEVFRPYYLEFGSINPLQWITSIFLHAGAVHLLGNMIFLFTFGLIVEGKIGTIKFLLIYLTIGMTECAIGQLLMINSAGAALGASGAIFGILAIAFIWAPRNDIKVSIVFFLIPFIAETVEISVMMFAFYFLAWEFLLEFLLIAMTDGGEFMSSQFCHLCGAAIGAIIGFSLLKLRRVDCEGFDLITVWRGKEGEAVKTVEQEAEAEQRRMQAAEQFKQDCKKAKQYIDLYIEHEKPEVAVGRFETHRKKYPGVDWDPSQLFKVIQLFMRQQNWDRAVELLEKLIKQCPQKKTAGQLIQAEIQILKNENYNAGLRALKQIDLQQLTDKQLKRVRQLAKKAEKRLEEGGLELSEL